MQRIYTFFLFVYNIHNASLSICYMKGIIELDINNGIMNDTWMSGSINIRHLGIGPVSIPSYYSASMRFNMVLHTSMTQYAPYQAVWQILDSMLLFYKHIDIYVLTEAHIDIWVLCRWPLQDIQKVSNSNFFRAFSSFLFCIYSYISFLCGSFNKLICILY